MGDKGGKKDKNKRANQNKSALSVKEKRERKKGVKE